MRAMPVFVERVVIPIDKVIADQVVDEAVFIGVTAIRPSDVGQQVASVDADVAVMIADVSRVVGVVQVDEADSPVAVDVAQQ